MIGTFCFFGCCEENVIKPQDSNVANLLGIGPPTWIITAHGYLWTKANLACPLTLSPTPQKKKSLDPNQKKADQLDLCVFLKKS
jgi:hypothetical protein